MILTKGSLYFTLITITIKLTIKFLKLSLNKPLIIMKNTLKNKQILSLCSSIYNFKPTILYCFDYYGTLQTIGQTILRNISKLFISKVYYHRELLHLSDGGTVGLDWVYNLEQQQQQQEQQERQQIVNKNDQNKPIVIIMHGLCGDSSAEYLIHLIEVLTKNNYRVVVMVARGCGGLELTTSVPFNGSRTLDFKETVDYIHSLYPNTPLFAMGFSLGAGLLLRYLSDYNNSSTNHILGGISVSPPWDFQIKSSWLFELLWTRLLTLLLKHYLITNYSKLKENFWPCLLYSTTIREFDSYYCKYGGFKDVDEYYDHCSPSTRLHLIQTPCLAISSIDDPICNVKGFPLYSENKNSNDNDNNNDNINNNVDNIIGEGLITVIVEHGGHLGFAEHILPLNSSWIDRLSLDYFSALLKINNYK